MHDRLITRKKIDPGTCLEFVALTVEFRPKVHPCNSGMNRDVGMLGGPGKDCIRTVLGNSHTANLSICTGNLHSYGGMPTGSRPCGRDH